MAFNIKSKIISFFVLELGHSTPFCVVIRCLKMRRHDSFQRRRDQNDVKRHRHNDYGRYNSKRQKRDESPSGRRHDNRGGKSDSKSYKWRTKDHSERVDNEKDSDKLFGSRTIDSFVNRKCISEGAYGLVYHAYDKTTNKKVALKQVKINPKKEKEGFPISSLREIKILSLCQHENIIRLREIVSDHSINSFYLVMDFVDNDLRDILHHLRGPMKIEHIKYLLYQLLKAVSYLHSKSFYHRDIKCANVLISNDGHLYLADFGLTRKFSDTHRPPTPTVVTLWYRAPELIFGAKNYTNAIDMWSVGCVMAELIRNKPLIPGETEIDQMNKMVDIFGAPTKENFGSSFESLTILEKVVLPNQRKNKLKHMFSDLTEKGFDLLNRLMLYNPEKRITADEAVKHPWFSENPLPERPSFKGIKKIVRDHK